MIPFADSSALVKLYADEQDSDIIRAVDRFVVAQIARVEVPAALWRKQRTGALSSRSTELLLTRFEIDWFGNDTEPRRFDPVRLSAIVLEAAARLSGVHGLRAYDAVQLATAGELRKVDPGSTVFATSDRTLRTAATTEGFTLLP